MLTHLVSRDSFKPRLGTLLSSTVADNIKGPRMTGRARQLRVKVASRGNSELLGSWLYISGPSHTAILVCSDVYFSQLPVLFGRSTLDYTMSSSDEDYEVLRSLQVSGYLYEPLRVQPQNNREDTSSESETSEEDDESDSENLPARDSPTIINPIETPDILLTDRFNIFCTYVSDRWRTPLVRCSACPHMASRLAAL